MLFAAVSRDAVRGGAGPGGRRGGPAAVGRQRAQDVPDQPEEFGRIRGAVTRVPAGGLGDEPVHLGRNAGREPGGGRDRLVNVLVRHRQRAFAGVRLGPGEQFVQHDAGRVDVGAGVGAGPGDLLGSQVRHGADDHAGPRLGVHRQRTGQAEVDHLEVTVRGDQHVLRLDVPVHDPGRVRGRQAGQQRHHDGQRLTRRETAPLGEQVPQRPAGHVLHGQVRVRAITALIEHGDHVGVREPRHRFGLADEPVDEILVPRQVGVHDLERHPAIQAGVDGAVHRRHAAERNQRLHLVTAVEQASDQGVREGSVHRGQLYEQVNDAGLDYPLLRPPPSGHSPEGRRRGRTPLRDPAGQPGPSAGDHGVPHRSGHQLRVAGAGDRGRQQHRVAAELHRDRGVTRGPDAGVQDDGHAGVGHDQLDVVRVPDAEPGADRCAERHDRGASGLLQAPR